MPGGGDVFSSRHWVRGYGSVRTPGVPSVPAYK